MSEIARLTRLCQRRQATINRLKDEHMVADEPRVEQVNLSQQTVAVSNLQPLWANDGSEKMA